MKHISSRPLVLTLAFQLAVCFAWMPTQVVAQGEQSFRSPLSGLLGDSADGSPPFTLSGGYSVVQGSRSGTLNVAMQLKSGWNGYSQKELPGQFPTTLNVAPDSYVKVIGPFVPSHQPKLVQDALGNDVEKFTGKVVWSAPIEFAESADLEHAVINVQLAGQVCNQACVPIAGNRSKVAARFSGYTKSSFEFVSGHGRITAQLDRNVVAADDSATLTFAAKASPKWHVYRLEKSQPEGTIHQPTIIYFKQADGFQLSFPVAEEEPVRVESGPKDKPYVYYCHKDPVNWKINIKPAAGTKPGRYELTGVMLAQFCSDSSCDQPAVLEFKLPITVADKSGSEPVNVSFYDSLESNRDRLMEQSASFWAKRNVAVGSTAAPLSELWLYLLFAFTAGLILNAMPCVLPVIGLKVMSFIQQAGEDRSRIFLLNLVFSLGLLSVFLVLATLSTFFRFGWGDWLTKSMTGSIVITGVVFAFGLSMLGVWEIPIPGMNGSSAISQKSEEEGLLGAFFLGILTTILATPCTGPMLVPAITFTAGQPPWIAYLIFSTIGIGMAMPYLLVGLFPSLIGWLPRPGAWMTTFKQVTGFILMATVVFLMSSFSEEPRSGYLIAMLTLLLCIALACWWVGRTSLAAESSEQVKAWGAGLAIVAIGGFVAFSYFVPSRYELNWQQYSKAALGELLDDNRLVFIDFTGPN